MRLYSHSCYFALVLLAGILMGAVPSRAQKPDLYTYAASDETLAKLLDRFFELGLPDTRHAKWVRLELGEGMLQIPGWMAEESPEAEGDAWLLKEHGDGTADVLLEHFRLSKVRVVRKGEAAPLPSDGDEMPTERILPADLASDRERVLARLKQAINHREAESRLESEDDFRAQQNRRLRTKALFLFAHLQRQGGAENLRVAREGLPLVYALAGGRELAIDGAVAFLAEMRYAALTEQRQRGGSAKASATGLDKLVADFPRGWRNALGAEVLAERLRKPRSPKADDRRAKAAADFLLSLSADELDRLPSGYWLLPRDGDHEFRMHPDEAYARASERREPDPWRRVDAFFAKPREAVLGLALLLEDTRLLQVTKACGEQVWLLDGGQRELTEREGAYGNILRPPELSEVARKLLQAVVPKKKLPPGEGEAARVQTWAESIVGLSDEELAWRGIIDAGGSAGTSEGFAFLPSLNYLIAEGSDETIAKLEEVFAKPISSWDRLKSLEHYAPRFRGDALALAAKIKAVLKPEDGDLAPEIVEKIDRMLTPTKLPEVLAELLGADEKEFERLLPFVRFAAAKLSAAEAEALVFRAAASAKPRTRARILTTMAGHHSTWLPRSWLTDVSPATDAAARATFQALLADDVEVSWSLEPGGSSFMESTVSALAAEALVWPRLSFDEKVAWHKIRERLPKTGRDWLRATALALVMGDRPVPLPDASRVSPAKLKQLVTELGQLSPGKLRSALAAKTYDQQLALDVYLKRAETVWPPAFIAARLEIVQVEGAEHLSTAGEWKGRVLNAKLVWEITAAMEDAARAGKLLNLSVIPSELFGGLRLSVLEVKKFRPSFDELVPTTLPPASSPEPFRVWHSANLLGPSEPPYFYYPVWPDKQQTRAWLEKNRASYAKDEDGADQLSKMALIHWRRNDPRLMEKATAEILACTPATRGNFQWSWGTALRNP